MPTPPPLPADQTFRWPEGFRAAVSVSFDDSRPSQLDHGVTIMERHGAKGTFYVTMDSMIRRLGDWQTLVRCGHEIGNHTLTHPCSGNFRWSRASALEDLTLDLMARDIDAADKQIREHFGDKAKTFAYPCGQTFVGRGAGQKSYVPLVADRFLVGRGFNNEFLNDPAFCDTASVAGIDMDCKSTRAVMAYVRHAVETGTWLVFAGHAVGEEGPQTVLTYALDELCRYCCDPGNGVWIDTVANIGQYIHTARTPPAGAGRKK